MTRFVTKATPINYCIEQNFGIVNFGGLFLNMHLAGKILVDLAKPSLLYFMRGYPVPSGFSSTS